MINFEQALDFQRDKGDDESIRVARWCVARCLRSLGRVDEAMSIQAKILDECDTLGEPSGYVHEELGELYLLRNRDEDKMHHFRIAHEILSRDSWLQANEPKRIERRQRLGQNQVTTSTLQ